MHADVVCRHAHASRVRRDALTALYDALVRCSRLYRTGEHLSDPAATVIPQRGPRGGRKFCSCVNHRMVEAPETVRDDNAPRDRIALSGSAAVLVAYHDAYLEEYDTTMPKIIAVRLAQLAQCTCDARRQMSGESGVISAACLCKCPIGSGASQTPAGESGSLGTVVRWVCRSRGPRACAGMALGAQKGGCGGTVGAWHPLEQKFDHTRLTVTRCSRLSSHRSEDVNASTGCAATDSRAVLAAAVIALPCGPEPAR